MNFCLLWTILIKTACLSICVGHVVQITRLLIEFSQEVTIERSFAKAYAVVFAQGVVRVRSGRCPPDPPDNPERKSGLGSL